VSRCGTLRHEMKNELLDAEVKTRIPKAHKKLLRDLAFSRHLKVADILREAIREKLNHQFISEIRDIRG
jgi:hypothetical protein